MALPSKLTTPLQTVNVDNPDVAAQLNINLTKQVLTNPGATATIDPTLGAVVVINTTTAATTLALIASPASALQVGQEVTVIITSSGVTPTLLAGTNVHLTATITLTANKAGVVKLVYDGTELKEIAASAALS